MSLAATLAASGMRPASFLPTIKCSSCGQDLEISAVGEHECPGTPPSPDRRHVPEAPRPPMSQSNPTDAYLPVSPTSDVYNDINDSNTRVRRDRSLTSPVRRIFDPRPPNSELPGNMDCAFPPWSTTEIKAKRKASTTSSSSKKSSRSGSHKHSRSTSEGVRSNTMSRSSTGRSNTSNGTSRGSTNDEKAHQEAKDLESWPSQPADPLTPVEEHPPPPPSPISHTMGGAHSNNDSPMFPPLQVQVAAAELNGKDIRAAVNEGKRIDEGPRSISGTIRQVLGRKPSEKKSAHIRPAFPNERHPALTEAHGLAIQHMPSQRKVPPPRPARPEEGLPADLLHPLTTMDISAHANSQPPPARLLETNRSQTLPLPAREFHETSNAHQLVRMQSEPVLRHKAGVTDTTRAETFLPSQHAANESRMDHRLQDAPPVPKAVQMHRSDSFHKSSESSSSVASSVLSLGNLSIGNSHSTTGTSPIVSAASSFDVSSPFASRLETIGRDDDGLPVAAAKLRPHLKSENHAEQPDDNMPTRTATVSTTLDAVHSPYEIPEHGSSTPDGFQEGHCESPMDPAFQDGKLAQTESLGPMSPSENPLKQLAGEPGKLGKFSSVVYEHPQRTSSTRTVDQPSQPQSTSVTSVASDFQGFNFEVTSDLSAEESDSTPTPSHETKDDSTSPALSPNDSDSSGELYTPRSESSQLSSIPETDAYPPPVQSGPNVNKSVCRGCGHLIEGKSIKAADGRLTGKWHKECFVCQGCRLPFETVNFYVINNLPYCEQHYHERNGSICFGCRRGIEGEYLETRPGPRGPPTRKYHRRCFTCVDCRMILTDDYFEVAGHVHCERHALAAARRQAGRPPPGPPGFPRGGSRLKAESFRAERQRTRVMQR